MYRICNTPRTIKVQHEYIKHLYYLMEEKPYQQISIQDICVRADGSRRSFYRYFQNKDGCLCALLDLIITQFYQYKMPEELKREGYHEGVLSLLVYFKDQNHLFEILLRNGLFDLYVERIIECARHNGVYALR